MEKYEVLRDINIGTRQGFKFFYGRRAEKPGQFLRFPGDITPEHLARMKAEDNVRLVSAYKIVVPSVKEPPIDVSVIPADVKKDKFNREIYFCKKCKKNHVAESRIGKEHRQ